MATDNATPAPAPNDWRAKLVPILERFAPLIQRWAVRAAIALVTFLLGWLGVQSPRTVEKEVPVPVPYAVPVEVPVPVAPMTSPGVAIDYEGLPYDGPPSGAEGVEANGKRWPTNRITWSMDYGSARNLASPLSEDAIRNAVKTAFAWWAESLELEFVEVASGAHIPMRFAPIDGPAGTLAYAFLADGTARPKELVLDAAERWTAGGPAPNQISLPTVLAHEIGHALALGHDDKGAPALMAPVYTSKVPREVPRDIERAVGLGYKRRAVDPAVPGNGGNAAYTTFPVTAKDSDMLDALKKKGYVFTAPK